eukprot:2358107-Amphidinium_carterae.1
MPLAGRRKLQTSALTSLQAILSASLLLQPPGSSSPMKGRTWQGGVAGFPKCEMFPDNTTAVWSAF